MVKVKIKAKHALPLWKGHPWVFRDSIQKIEGKAQAGDLVEVYDPQDRWIGSGWYSPESQIQVRLLTWSSHEDVSHSDFLTLRIQQAIDLRKSTLKVQEQSNSYRLVHSEGDRLPGLVADWFNGSLVLAFSTAGMYRFRHHVQEIFQAQLNPQHLFCIEDPHLAQEGILSRRPPPQTQDSEEISETPLSSPQASQPVSVQIEENGCRYQVMLGFQKTGFYFDQRENRLSFRRWAFGEVLDAFCFSGAFGINALKGLAQHCTFLESSAQALEYCKQNLKENQLEGECLQGDVHELLNQWKREGRRFDTICLDPPKWVPQKSHFKRGIQKYRAVNQLGMQLLKPGGLLFSFSCSGAVQEQDFLRMINDAGQGAHRSVQILHRFQQAPDHPFLPACPQSLYLKGILARIGN